MTSQGHILIVDDDRSTLNILAAALEKHGYQVEKATSGKEAINQIYDREPVLAILDIVLPDMSGFEIADRLLEQTNVPFMFMTASSETEDLKRGIEQGAVGYVVKPFTPHNLIPAVEAGLARAKEIRALRHREANLEIALATGRETGFAVGLIMARYRLDSNTAFEVLRDHARTHRRKVNEVAKEIVQAEEVFSQLTPIVHRKMARA